MTTEPDETELDAFFDAARRQPGPSDDLIARVLADADAQAAAPAPQPASKPTRKGVIDALGGWLTITGLAATCAAGLAIGVALPSAVMANSDGPLAALLGGESYVAGFDAAFFIQDVGVSE
ncbi:MAG: hypothetical protein AAGA70_05345 [Pseudomonadota bacterium]